MIEYASIYLKRQSVEYARIILNVSDAVHSIRSLYKLLNSYRDRDLWAVELDTSVNISSKTQEKQAAQGNILDFFLKENLRTIFWVKNLTQWWTQSGPFFPKSEHFFLFSKKTGEAYSLLHSCAPKSVAEYEAISLNISKYPRKILNKLIWLF